jgi:hypothetical protein
LRTARIGAIAPSSVQAQQQPPPAPERTNCDEVSCVLDNWAGQCCHKLKRTVPPPPKDPRPEALDREAISSGMAAVKANALACGARSSAKGIVKVHVKVAPDGHVSAITVTQTPDVVLGRCVADAVQAAVFAPTQTGGSFSYPYPFDAKRGTGTLIVTSVPWAYVTIDDDATNRRATPARFELAPGHHKVRLENSETHQTLTEHPLISVDDLVKIRINEQDWP